MCLLSAGLVGLVGCANGPMPVRSGLRRPSAEAMAGDRGGGGSAFERGMRHVEQLEYERAIESFGVALRGIELARQRRDAQRMVGGPPLPAAVSAQAQADRKRAEVLFWLAYAYEKTGRTQAAVRFYHQLAAEHPDQPFADQAARRAERLVEGRL
jgi:tetratricopeptide (TPR) repeat protein